MALSATVYRITLELSDVDRGIYESLEFRVAQHPSESRKRVVARILAYALFYDEYLEFGKGLSSANEPALWSRDLTGRILHWIDVGAPSAERIHSASKKSEAVTIVAHKGLDALSREIGKKRIHKADEITVLELDPSFVDQLEAALERTSSWTAVISMEDLSITIDDQHFSTTVNKVPLPRRASTPS